MFVYISISISSTYILSSRISSSARLIKDRGRKRDYYYFYVCCVFKPENHILPYNNDDEKRNEEGGKKIILSFFLRHSFILDCAPLSLNKSRLF